MTKLRFECIKCKSTLRVPIQHVGKMVACPECGAPNRVPSPGRKHHEEVDVDDGSLKLPPRTSHARYHDELQAEAVDARRRAAQRAEADAQRKSRRIWWLLVAVNVLVFAALVTALALVWPPGDGGEPHPDPPAPTTGDGSLPSF